MERAILHVVSVSLTQLCDFTIVTLKAIEMANLGQERDVAVLDEVQVF